MPWGISALRQYSMSWHKYKKKAGVITVPKQGRRSPKDPLRQGHIQMFNWGTAGWMLLVYIFKILRTTLGNLYSNLEWEWGETRKAFFFCLPCGKRQQSMGEQQGPGWAFRGLWRLLVGPAELEKPWVQRLQEIPKVLLFTSRLCPRPGKA